MSDAFYATNLGILPSTARGIYQGNDHGMPVKGSRHPQIVAIKIFAVILPSQPLLGRHL